ncbi:MAG: hypothetical protein V1792_13055 [Pseudomonadota bacterium]
MNHYPYQSYQGYYPQYYSPGAGLGPFDASRALAAGGTGFVVGGSAALGVNLHRVQANQMTLNEALIDTVVKGAGAGVATAAAAAAASAVGGTGMTRFALMFAAATGVIYLLNSIGRQATSEVVVSSRKAK